MSGSGPILVIAPTSGAVPLRQKITKMLTTVGSESSADLRLTVVPPRWVVVQRVSDDALLIRNLRTGTAHQLGRGERLTVDRIELSVEGEAERVESREGLPVGALAEALAGVEAPSDALRLLLRGVMEATAAESGAIILRDGQDYGIPVAETADGTPLREAAALLSDTVVRDVLEGGRHLRLVDAAATQRYAQVPSVIALRLRSVLCVPMLMGERPLGAIFLGRRDARAAFSERHVSDLEVLATMAVPVLAQLRRAEERASSVEAERDAVGDLLLGDCPAMVSLRELVRRAAPADLSVMIHGETGTGKEVVAKAIHAASLRADRPLVALNCAAVPESLLAAELFGAKKGAFTGAVADRMGRIEQANGSTLFLDEVGDMPLPMQAALLRVLEERVVTRVGDTVERPVDFRLIAATHKDLEAEAAAGSFRQDMLFRLKELTMTLPPLRERGEDIILLANLFLRQTERQLGLPRRRLSDASTELLRRHRWPGNVRELRAAARRAAVLCDGDSIEPANLQIEASGRSAVPGQFLGQWSDRPLAEAKDAFVAGYVAAAVERHGGNRESAAAALGISLRSLYRYLGQR